VALRIIVIGAANLPVALSLVGIGLAALAAAASWASVRLNRKQWLLAQQPFLSVQLEIENGERILKILNAGAGPARGVRFCLATGDEFASGYAGPQYGGLLHPGKRAEIVLDLEANRDDSIRGVAVCWDGVERIHSFGAKAEHSIRRRRRRGRGDGTDPEEAFRKRYGSDALAGLRRVKGHGRAP
jgi:hypothetical protein